MIDCGIQDAIVYVHTDWFYGTLFTFPTDQVIKIAPPFSILYFGVDAFDYFIKQVINEPFLYPVLIQ
jgi:hypothetical protein